METWNVFTTTDLFLGLLGAVGFLSMVTVIVTATGRVDKREKTLKAAQTLQSLEPDEKVLSYWSEDAQEYYGDGDHYDTSGK